MHKNAHSRAQSHPPHTQGARSHQHDVKLTRRRLDWCVRPNVYGAMATCELHMPQEVFEQVQAEEIAARTAIDAAAERLRRAQRLQRFMAPEMTPLELETVQTEENAAKTAHGAARQRWHNALEVLSMADLATWRAQYGLGRPGTLSRCVLTICCSLLICCLFSR